jgi:hypothetical protein
VDLPGREKAEAPIRRNGHPVWTAGVGDEVRIRASSSVRDLGRVAWLSASVLLAAAAAAVWVGVRRRRWVRV